jgi:hypothetical protein
MRSLQPTFSEAFAIEELLEQSLYRVLYKGSDRTFGQPVLIQHWPTAAIVTPEEKERLAQEVILFQQRTHPHILPIAKTFTQQRGVSLISPYPRRGSLQAQLDQHSSRPLPLKDALAVLRQVGQALHHAHQYEILHGALTPGAIFFIEKQQAVVVGFRFQSILETIPDYHPEQEGRLPDIWYMAPEQFEGVLDEKTDQYALGCLAYRLLTGHVPFPDQTRAAIIHKHRNELPQPLTAYNSHIPPYIENAVLRTLAKRPEQRHASVQDFLHALETPAAQAQILAPDTRPYFAAAGALSNPQMPAVQVQAPDARPYSVPVGTPGNLQTPTAQELYARPAYGKKLPGGVFHASWKGRKWPVMLGLASLILIIAVVAITMSAAAFGGRSVKDTLPTKLPTRVAVVHHQATPTATPVPVSSTPTLVPTSPPIAAGPSPMPVTTSCHINYQTTNEGSIIIGGGSASGFSADVTINNTGSGAINGWTLVFAYSKGQQIFSSIDSNVSQSGAQVTVTNDGNSAMIPPGQSVTVTLIGGWNGTSNPSPTTFKLNNITCH